MIMASLPLKSLVSKLNPVCRGALEAAAGLCLSRTNHYVEIEHYLLKLLEANDTDLPRIFKQYEVDLSVARRELTRSLDQLKTGNARAPALSLDILQWLREAWVMASLHYEAGKIRSGYLLTALLSHADLSRRVFDSAPVLKKFPAESLTNDLPVLIK